MDGNKIKYFTCSHRLNIVVYEPAFIVVMALFIIGNEMKDVGNEIENLPMFFLYFVSIDWYLLISIYQNLEGKSNSHVKLKIITHNFSLILTVTITIRKLKARNRNYFPILLSVSTTICNLSKNIFMNCLLLIKNAEGICLRLRVVDLGGMHTISWIVRPTINNIHGRVDSTN